MGNTLSRMENLKTCLQYEKLNENALAPSKNEMIAGYDLHSSEDVVIPKFNKARVKTGLKI